MGIRIRTNEATIEVDTSDELQTVLRALRNLNVQLISSSNQSEAKPNKRSSESTPHRDYQRFFKELGDTRQAHILIALRQADNAEMSDIEIRNQFGMKSNNELAGTMAGIAKHAKRAGFNIDEIIIKTMFQGTNRKRSYRYKLTDGMKNFVPGALPLTKFIEDEF